MLFNPKSVTICICMIVLLLNPGSMIFAGNIPEPGKPAPVFNLSDLGNENIYKLNDFNGHVVILDFWASWCTPCKKSLPKLNAIAKEYQDKIKIIAISIDDKIENAIKFTGHQYPNLIILHDGEKETVKDYDIPAMPTLFIIDSQGVIYKVHGGYTEKDMDSIIKDALGAQ